MQQLNFTAQADGSRSATFITSDVNVLQLHFAAGDSRYLTVNHRIDSSLPWVMLRLIASAPQQMIVNLPLPAGIEVQLLTDADVEIAALKDE